MPVEPDDRVTLSQAESVDQLVASLRGALAAAGDPEKAPIIQRYMKSAMPFLGLRMATMRQISRTLMNERRLPDRTSWEAAVRTLWDEAAYREERYAAIVLTGHRNYRAFQDPGTLDLYRHLVETGAWWDFVDDVASNRVGPILRADPGTVTPLMREWARDEHLWVRRTAILCQLGSKDGTDTALLADVLGANLEDSLHGRDFFIRKAVGWALRQHARTDEAWVVGYVEAHRDRLSGLSVREALKHVSR